jgi:ribose 5-phosphate isomerase B
LEKEYGRIQDLGPKEFMPDDDYPDYAKKVAEKISKNPEGDFGILICRSGQGVCIAANKFKSVRAGLVWNTKEAKASRTDDHTNVLCLPSDYISVALAKDIVKQWLNTPWSKDARHVRRVRKISKLEL